jgi:glycosyltransferase involved in cell wall biosynthesis
VRTEGAARHDNLPTFEDVASAPLWVTDPARERRALHVCTRYLRGGSERRIADIVRALPELDHHLLVGAESDLARARADLPAISMEGEPTLVRAVDPRRDARALVRLTGVIRGGRFAVVFTHQSKSGALGRIAARIAGGIPVIHSLSMANFGPGYGRFEDRAFRSVERLLAPYTAGYCVVGHDLARRYRMIGVPAHKLHIVRSGAPLPSAATTRPAARRRLARLYSIPEGRPVIAYIGSLDRRKNVLLLPDLLTAVFERSEQPPFLAVAGEGPLQQDLAAEISRAGRSADTALLGHVSPVDDLLIGADVVVLLSSAEGLPQVLLQAAAAGTPFVAYEVDGVAEVLGLGASGRSVPFGHLAAMADAVVPYLEGSVPCTRVGRGVLDQWAPATVAEGHRSVLRAVLGSGPLDRPQSVTEFR